MEELFIDAQNYQLEIFQRQNNSHDVPRLAIVAYQSNYLGRELLRVCIEGIQRFSIIPYELWIIDNNSPYEEKYWLLDYSDINAVFNLTEPKVPKKLFDRYRINALLKGKKKHPYEASYANAIALEIVIRLINPDSKYFMSLHMDTLPCHFNWLNFLKSKIDDGYSAAGVRKDTFRIPEGVLHVLGCLVDFEIFRRLNLDYLPSLPKYDVGDRVTTKFLEYGYKVYSCRNTLWEPELEQLIDNLSPLKHFKVDRSFDDKNNVIFLHLGRGIQKSKKKVNHGTSVSSWISFAQAHLFR